jgi:hypothetical protein
LLRILSFEAQFPEWKWNLVTSFFTSHSSAINQQKVSATRDNDYIHTCVDRGLHDPFIISSNRYVDAAILNAALLDVPLELREVLSVRLVKGKEKFNFVPPLEAAAQAIGGTRIRMTRKQRSTAFIKRILYSIIGGAFLVGPMWLMIKVDTLYASLVSTSVFVFVAGIDLAWALENPVAVVSTTAAYAAVLVVFVGTSNTGVSTASSLESSST